MEPDGAGSCKQPLRTLSRVSGKNCGFPQEIAERIWTERRPGGGRGASVRAGRVVRKLLQPLRER